ncbi:hypothetical protein [Burkholderia sp. F1]|uniref:hypothetical protein n=1 Tax=Burkholderia sp. F1 TaxID=3366817 RepID=UPI003D747460
MNAWPWSVLEIDDGSDERAVRRAYARALKQRRADEDPDAFQALRGAYEHALLLARNAASGETITLVETDGSRPDRPPADLEQRIEADGVGQAAAPALPMQPMQAAQSMPPPPDHAPDPAAEAARIWDGFSADPGNVTSQRAIKALFASAVSIALRDELEWAALMYCLRDDIPADSRSDLADVLNWREGAGHLMQRNAYLARQALSRIFADEEHAQARRHFPAAVDMLERPLPGVTRALLLLADRNRHREMEALLFALQAHFVNARNLRFDGERVAFWRDACTRRTKAIRLCVTAPVLGLWCGLLVASGLAGMGVLGAAPAWGGLQGAIMGAAALLTMLVYGVAEFGASTLSLRWRRVARERAVVRYGWVALWVAASCAAYADARVGIVTSVALLSLAAATVWAVAVHGWPRLPGLAALCVCAAFGFGFFGYYVRVAGGPWQVPIAQGVLYGLFAGFVQGELRAIVERWRGLRFAATLAWFAAGAATAFMLMGMELADFSSAWAEPAWSMYALLIVAGSLVGTMRWGQLAAILPSVFRGWMYIIWVVLASMKPPYAAFIVLCLMSYWIVQDMKQRRAD